MNMLAASAVIDDFGVGEAALSAILGYAVVFLGLVLLMLVVMLVGKIMTQKAVEKPVAAVAAPAAAPVPTAPKAPPAPGSAGEVKLYGTSDKDAALIMAIVANRMGRPVNELRFISIKEVK